jgi:hypothetical protein
VHSEAIQVESHWLKTVLQQVEKDRPIHRKVNALDTSHLESPIAFLQPDATLVPGTTMRDSLAIEIKVISQVKHLLGLAQVGIFTQGS